jgi:hypothetical protein
MFDAPTHLLILLFDVPTRLGLLFQAQRRLSF